MQVHYKLAGHVIRIESNRAVKKKFSKWVELHKVGEVSNVQRCPKNSSLNLQNPSRGSFETPTSKNKMKIDKFRKV